MRSRTSRRSTHDNLDALTPRAALSDYLPGDRRRLSDEVRVAKATVAYWLGRYGAVAADTDRRRSGRGRFCWLPRTPRFARPARSRRRVRRRCSASTACCRPTRSRVEGVAQRSVAEAAYNYEYVARIRDQVARSPQGRIAKSPAAAGPVMGGDLAGGRHDPWRARRAAARREDGGAADRSRRWNTAIAKRSLKRRPAPSASARGEHRLLSGRRSSCGSSPRPACSCWRGCGASRAASPICAGCATPIDSVRERFALGGDLWFWFFLILVVRLVRRRARPPARRHHRHQPRRPRHRRLAGRLGVDARDGCVRLRSHEFRRATARQRVARRRRAGSDRWTFSGCSATR